MTSHSPTMLSGVNFGEWLTLHWMRAGIVMAAVLLAITPALAHFLPWSLVLVYLQLPIYMIHQYEEHAQGAFQRYADQMIGHGRTVFSARDILWINLGLVWSLDVLWLLLAVLVNPVWGMIPPAMAAVNGALHVADALRHRRYNPGLWSAVGLFLPGGIFALLTIGRSVGADRWMYGLVILAALLTHAPILLFVRRQLKTPSLT